MPRAQDKMDRRDSAPKAGRESAEAKSALRERAEREVVQQSLGQSAEPVRWDEV
jgi:hypothetical protein